MSDHFNLIYKPECFHGHNQKNNFFEGWYYKIVDKSGKYVFAVIPGIFISDDPKKHHCFIQFIDGISGESFYFKFDPKDFKIPEEQFDLSILNNKFSLENLNLELESDNIKVQSKIKIKETIPWPVTKKSPGVMGWYAYIPIMECYHGILSLESDLQGYITVNDTEISLDGAKCYIEKDWGRNFPISYVWLQSNHFNSEETICVTGSVARIPWLGTSFKGFIFGLYYKNQLHRFTTYNSTKLDLLNISDSIIEIKLRSKTHTLEISAERRNPGKKLFAPFEGDMVERVVENLDGIIHLTFADLNGNVIFEGKGIHSGIEANGNLEEIADRLS